MRSHNVGVETGQDRDTAEHRLKRDAEALKQSQPKKVSASSAKTKDKRESEDGDRREHESQHPVGKFNNAVDAHFWRIGERFGGAARPGGAAQP